jgi:hypothetical protein
MIYAPDCRLWIPEQQPQESLKKMSDETAAGSYDDWRTGWNKSDIELCCVRHDNTYRSSRF